MADIDGMADRLGVPRWWVEAVTVEYLPCRRFAAEREIWDFDFGLVSDEEVAIACSETRVVAYGTVYHNVRREVWSERMLARMVSGVPVPLTVSVTDAVPEGPIGPHHVHWMGNSIDVWDPKLNFSRHVQVRDSDGLWQWDVARFEVVAGRQYGKWVSDVVNLEPLDEIHPRLAVLRNAPEVRRTDDEGHEEFRARVADFYVWLESIREPIRDALLAVHQTRKSGSWRSTVVKGTPPFLSQFEDFKVEDGEVLTRLHGEPLLFRACVEHAHAAVAAGTDPTTADRSIVERVEAVISAAACLEAFINSVGSETVARWDLYEKLTIEGKWQLCLATSGHSDRYDPGRQPFQTLGQVVQLRNRWLHYGRPFERVRRTHDGVLTWVDARMSNKFVAELPDRLRELVIDMCDATGRPIPAWLQSGPTWSL